VSLSSLAAWWAPVDSAWPFAACPFTDGMSAGGMSAGFRSAGRMSAAGGPSSSLREWPSSGWMGFIECGMPGAVQVRSWDSAGALATMITPTTSATIPAACIASRPGDTWIRSPNTMTPSRRPTSGSPAEMAGSDSFSGAALNALCISQMPIAPAPTRAYGAQVVNSALMPLDCKICSVCLVSASWMPNTRPAPTPVRMARDRP
jgi:hypothetical protein